MSNTSQVASSYVQEGVFGTTPVTPTMKAVRLASHSIKRVTSLARSAEIRSDRQNSELIPVGVTVAGQISGEMTYGTWDVFLQQSLQSAAWSTLVTNTGAIYAVTGAGAGFCTIHRSTGDWTVDYGAFGAGGVDAIGKWVKVTGFAGATNNVRARISSITALNLGLSFTGGTPVNEAEGPTVTVKLLEDITEGVTQGSISWEDAFTDVSLFRQFVGLVFNGFDITLQESGPILISFDVMGKEETDSSSTVATVLTAVNTNPVMSSGLNVASVYEGNATQTSLARAAISVRNSIRRRGALGSITAQSFGSGDIMANGNFDNYFSTGTIHAKVLAYQDTNFILQVVDSLGQGYIIDMPATKYSEGDRPITGKNGDVFGKYVFDTKRHATLGHTLRIARFT